MQKFFVHIHSIEEAREFVAICSQLPADINLSSGKREVDGKSLLGVLSLDLTIPVQVEIISGEKVNLSVFEQFVEGV